MGALAAIALTRVSTSALSDSAGTTFGHQSDFHGRCGIDDFRIRINSSFTFAVMRGNRCVPRRTGSNPLPLPGSRNAPFAQ